MIKLFRDAVEPIFKLLSLSKRKNELLRQTRDLLLPRLISGEIDVENLDIRIGDSDEPDI